MPLFHYVCECSHSEKKFHRRAKDAPSVIVCEKCQKDMKKSLSAPSQSSKISIDNGFQARRVEVAPDVIEVFEQRSQKDYREK